MQPHRSNVPGTSSQATRLLKSLSAAEPEAAAGLFPLVYSELKGLAAALMHRERANHTLQATALVHEAYFKLIDKEAQSFENRAQFLGIAGRAMRQVLVDHARSHKGAKRGGGWMRVTLSDAASPQGLSHEDLLSLEDALSGLARRDERLAKVVELRSFAGLTIQETATLLGVSHSTVEEDWSLARAWLGRELSKGAH
jgi:RNA polymerase sigma factor (TIGR02999 family)